MGRSSEPGCRRRDGIKTRCRENLRPGNSRKADGSTAPRADGLGTRSKRKLSTKASILPIMTRASKDVVTFVAADGRVPSREPNVPRPCLGPSVDRAKITVVVIGVIVGVAPGLVTATGPANIG
jgi:hypothetical protein